MARMTKLEQYRDIAVHALSSVHRMEPVFYASMPRDTVARWGHGTDGGSARHRLVSSLWEHAATLASPLWKCRLSPTGVAPPIQVTHDPLGKPRLLSGEHREPGISFSESGQSVWGALCGNESDIGIDVAEPHEFQGDYPFSRVFNARELRHAVELARGDVARAAALLWSVKEAVVKALGCGFHFVEPRDIHAQPAAAEDDGYAFAVRLGGKALERLPAGAAQSLWVRSLPRMGMWLSIALVKKESTFGKVRGAIPGTPPPGAG